MQLLNMPTKRRNHGYRPKERPEKVLQGEASLNSYQFNTNVARHYFCSNCGIYTHHQRRSNPNEYGYNVGCLEGVNPFDLEPVRLSDGANHPLDRKA